MNRFTKTTAIALVFSLAGLAGAHAAQMLNTTPLNYLGQPVSSKPVTTAAGLQANTTITPFHISTTPVTTAAGLQANTTITPFHISTTPVTTAAGLQANTTVTPLHISTTPVTTAAGLSANTTITPLHISTTPVTTAAGLAAGGSTFAAPNVKATIATGPIPVPKPGTTTPDYGPYTGASSAPDSLASLTDLTAPSSTSSVTDLQTAISQSNGLTNLQMFGWGEAGSKVGAAIGGASGGAPSMFVSNAQNAFTAAGNAIAANIAAAQSSAGALAGAAANAKPAPQSGLSAGGALGAVNSVASLINQSQWTAAAATSDAGNNGGLGTAPPIVIKLPTNGANGSGAINIGTSQANATNSFIIANPFGSNNPNPSSVGSQLNGSVPAIFNVGLPTQGAPPLTAGDINAVQGIATDWGYLGMAILGAGGLSGAGKIGINASVVNPVTATETGFGTGLGGSAGGGLTGGAAQTAGVNPLSNMIKALLGKY